MNNPSACWRVFRTALLTAGSLACAPSQSQQTDGGAGGGVDTNLLKQAKYAKAPYLSGISVDGSAASIPLLADVEMQLSAAAKDLAPDASPTFRSVRKFALVSPNGDTLDYYVAAATVNGAVASPPPTTVTAYAISLSGTWAVWGEAISASNGAIASRFVIAQNDGSTRTLAEPDFRALLGARAAPVSTALNAAAVCTGVNDICKVGVRILSRALCDEEFLVGAAAVVSCAAAIFDEGTTAAGCGVVLIEFFAQEPLCKLAQDLFSGPIGTAVCDLAVGCGLDKFGLGCDCSWRDPAREGCSVACGAVDDAYCAAVGLTASTITGVDSAIDSICRSSEVCKDVWEIGCGHYAEATGVKNFTDYCTGKCQLLIGDSACGQSGQECCESDLCRTDLGLSCQAGLCRSGTADVVPPSVPIGLIPTAFSANEIKLTWRASTDDVGVNGYWVYRDGFRLKTATGTSALDDTINPSTRYCYSVSAFDDTGNESARSVQACITAATAAASCSTTGGSCGLTIGGVLCTSATGGTCATGDCNLDGACVVTPPPATPPSPPSWQSQFSGTTNTLAAVTASPNGFVAVGLQGTIVTSPDGASWRVLPSVGGDLFDVTYGNGVFLAVGGDACNTICFTKIMRSIDGISWANVGPQITAWFEGLAYGNGVFVVGGSFSSYMSKDGLAWTMISIPTIEVVRISFINGRFVAVGRSGTIAISTDGVKWTARTTSTSDILNDVAFDGKNYVVVGEPSVGGAGTVLTSPDLLTWAGHTPPWTTSLLRRVAHGTDGFIAVGGDGILASPDGKSWTQVVTSSLFEGYGVVWTGSRFVAVGAGGAILTR